MALNPIDVEIRTTGNDDNGGGFRRGASGIDRSQQTTPHATLTAASVVSATTTKIDVSPSDHTVKADDVGNVFQLKGGTATPGFYEIISVETGANKRWVTNRSMGTAGQTCNGRMGGCLATPGVAGEVAPANNGVANAGVHFWVREGIYTLTTATAGVRGGPVYLDGNTHGLLTMQGYATTRGDAGRATLRPAAFTNAQLFSGSTSFSNKQIQYRNLIADGQNVAGVDGFVLQGAYGTAIAENCIAFDCEYGLYVKHGKAYGCLAYGCSLYGLWFDFTSQGRFCTAYDCNIGFRCQGTYVPLDFCLAYACTSHGYENAATYGTFATHCVADGCGGNGFHFPSYDMNFLNACVATNNSGYGFNLNGTYFGTRVANCFARNNASGASNQTLQEDIVALASDPWVDSANVDLTLRDYTPADSQLLLSRLTAVYGYPGTLYAGAVQPQASGGSGYSRGRVVNA